MNSFSDGNSFVYQIDLRNEFDFFSSLPKEIQADIERDIVTIIYESFVISADEDYLMARFFARHGLARGFFWAAAQSIEKYLKAFLLFRGHSVKDYKYHPVKEIFNDVTNSEPSLLRLNIHPHPKIKINNEVAETFLSRFEPTEFVENIAKQGHPNIRYNGFGTDFDTGYLFALDSLIFKLRESIGVIAIEHSFKNTDAYLNNIFKDNNYWFCRDSQFVHSELPSKAFPIIAPTTVTSLDYIRKNKPNSLALTWLNKKMKLPKNK